jgi:hypothetical protein
MIKSVSVERLSICDGCPQHSKHFKTIRPDAHCTNCGCTLSAKTKCLSCACPLNKWAAIVSQEDEEQMKKTIKDDGNSKT